MSARQGRQLRLLAEPKGPRCHGDESHVCGLDKGGQVVPRVDGRGVDEQEEGVLWGGNGQVPRQMVGVAPDPGKVVLHVAAVDADAHGLYPSSGGTMRRYTHRPAASRACATPP